MRRVTYNTEIDFDNLCGVETSYSTAISAQDRLYAFHNPYVGNKRKMISDLIRILENNKIQYESVLDLFSGSGAVSIAMKLLGKRVVSNDLLTSSYLNTKAFVENNLITLSSEDKNNLINNSCQQFNNIVYKYSNRFTLNEMNFLSHYYNNVFKHYWNPKNIKCSSDEISIYKAALAMVYLQNYIMDHCFVGGRLNNGQVLADVDHRISHARNNGKEMLFQNMFEVEPPFGDNKIKHCAYNMDAKNLILNIHPQVDVCYIDPPYGGDQSDYSQMFQFFEEFIYQSPVSELEHIKKSTSFSKKEKYKDNFVELLSLLGYIPNWIISYNNSSWDGIESIINCVKQFRTNVCVEEIKYAYKYRKKQKNTQETKEYVIIAKEI
jgi:adenine-specific DNA methylase